jgi:hypothetical protein
LLNGCFVHDDSPFLRIVCGQGAAWWLVAHNFINIVFFDTVFEFDCCNISGNVQ